MPPGAPRPSSESRACRRLPRKQPGRAAGGRQTRPPTERQHKPAATFSEDISRISEPSSDLENTTRFWESRHADRSYLKLGTIIRDHGSYWDSHLAFRPKHNAMQFL